MRILVVGGSSFVGRHIAEQLLARGHQLTLFNRGRTNPGLFPDAEHLTGDRNGDLSMLAGRRWDATVDVCAYVPRQVRRLLETLGDGAGHYTFISTLSVYGHQVADHGFDETSPLLAPAWDDAPDVEKYGELKTGCEQVAGDLAGDRLLIVRPGYVIGPHDPTHRFTYWVERVADGRGPIVGPDADQPLQAVDARDLGAFVATQVERGTVDAFHVTAPDPAPTFDAWLATIAHAVGVDLAEVRWVGARDELPLSAPAAWWPKMRASPAKARAAGFSWRPQEVTARDTFEWVRGERAAGRYTPPAGVGLTADQERELSAQA